MKDLSVKVAGVTFPNPVIAASGTYGFGEDYAPLYPLNKLGGISCKGTTMNEKPGNVPPRIAETTAGMLNAVGLQNPGVEVFVNKYLPKLKKEGNVIIANVAGATLDDYRNIAERLDSTDVDMIELNISCPNVKQGGATWGTSCEGAATVT
ncbi:MAG: dihydroorotate dehydrogenase, partial [Ruminiclostridium sp.]|nr:dihydroorotate dehydrogenase [Ruminiclostridium sp.]